MRFAETAQRNRLEACRSQRLGRQIVAIQGEDDAESFFVPQRLCQRQAALHMAIAIDAAAIAMDQRGTARRLRAFLPDMRIHRFQARLAEVVRPEDIPQWLDFASSYWTPLPAMAGAYLCQWRAMRPSMVAQA